MKVKELKKGLEKVDDELEIFIEAFGVEAELDIENWVIMKEKLIIVTDEGCFLPSPFTSDNE